MQTGQEPFRTRRVSRIVAVWEDYRKSDLQKANLFSDSVRAMFYPLCFTPKTDAFCVVHRIVTRSCNCGYAAYAIRCGT